MSEIENQPEGTQETRDQTEQPPSDVVQMLETLVSDTTGMVETSLRRNSNDVIDPQEQINKIEVLFESIKDKLALDAKIKYWTLLGRMYGLIPKYIPRAIDCLGKVVKLDATNVTAWNLLGELYWKIGEVVLSKQCFESALKQERNKVSLRNLSIISRREVVVNREVSREKLLEGVKFAREAVQLDATDADSWAILGNAYLSSYFQPLAQSTALSCAISAYKQAERSATGAATNQDLFYNKGIALKFDEQYEEAVESFRIALTIDPNWELCHRSLDRILEYILKVQALVENKGKIGGRRLQTMRKEIMDVKRSELDDYETVTLKSLQEGVNLKKLISGKVIWSCQLDATFPFTVGMVDRDGEICVVTIFNVASSKGFKIGDTLSIPDPKFNLVSFTLDDKEICFKKIRVNTPAHAFMNGRTVPPDFYGPMVWDSSLY